MHKFVQPNLIEQLSAWKDSLKSAPLKLPKSQVHGNGIYTSCGRKPFQHYHTIVLHAGSQLVLSTIRLNYWAIGGRTFVCLMNHRTSRANPSVLIQRSTSDLPKSRITQDHPLAISGIDYCGPVFIKSPIRSRATSKTHILIFVGFTTKAVYNELLTDLS